MVDKIALFIGRAVIWAVILSAGLMLFGWVNYGFGRLRSKQWARTDVRK